MEAEPACLEVQDLPIRYGNREVLCGLNLRVGRGEIYGMSGPNGAGKTTLVRTICGRVKPRAGGVSVSLRLRL